MGKIIPLLTYWMHSLREKIRAFNARRRQAHLKAGWKVKYEQTARRTLLIKRVVVLLLIIALLFYVYRGNEEASTPSEISPPLQEAPSASEEQLPQPPLQPSLVEDNLSEPLLHPFPESQNVSEAPNVSETLVEETEPETTNETLELTELSPENFSDRAQRAINKVQRSLNETIFLLAGTTNEKALSFIDSAQRKLTDAQRLFSEGNFTGAKDVADGAYKNVRSARVFVSAAS